MFRACVLAESHRYLRNSFMPRLLKKVQVQGGKRCAGYPPQVGAGVLGPYAAASRERGGTHGRWAPIRMGTRQMGPFSAAGYAARHRIA